METLGFYRVSMTTDHGVYRVLLGFLSDVLDFADLQCFFLWGFYKVRKGKLEVNL